MTLATISGGTPSLASFLPTGQGQICEEELFTALLAYQLNQKFGAKTAQFFQQQVQSNLGKPAKNGRKVGHEDAGYMALDALVKQKAITAKEKETILATCFEAAQLDANKNALWDAVGGKDDPTKAVASYDVALQSANKALQEIHAGIRRPAPPPKGEISSTSKGSDGFLFKPVSNSSGTASVLISAALGREARSVTLQDGSGHVLDTGRFTSFGDDGSRAKYVFSKPGNAYPKNLVVVVTLSDGTTTQIAVGDPAKRTG